MKKIFVLMLSVAMTLSLVSCGDSKAPAASTPAASTPATSTPAASTPAPNANPMPEVKPMDINFGGGAMGGTYYIVASAMKTLAEENCDSVKSFTVLTGSSNQFANECSKEGTVDIFMNTLDALNYAYQGIGKQGFTEGDALDNLNVVSLMYGMPLMLVTLESNSNIQSAADITGTVGVGSATLAGPATDLLKAAGVENPDVAVVNDYNQLNQNLIDGTYQAVIHTGPAPQAYTLNLIASADVKIVSLPAGTANAAVGMGGDATYCQVVKVPKGAYEFVTEDYETIARTASITCNEEIPERVIYEFVKAVYENSDAIESVISFSEMNKEGMQAVANSGLLNMPVHPGARRYYEEIGITFPSSVPVK